MMTETPEAFKAAVHKSLVRQVAAINRHSKPVMEALIKARYSPFLAAKAAPKTAVAAPGAVKGPVSPNVEVRTVMPSRDEIDFQHTPLEWMASTRPGGKQYRLYSGKVIQVRSA